MHLDISFQEVAAQEEKFYLIWLLSVSAATVATFAAHEPAVQFAAPYCWITHTKHNVFKVAFFNTPMFIGLIYGLYRIVPLIRKLLRVRATSTSEQSSTIQAYIWRHTMFFLFFAVDFALLLAFETNEALWSLGYGRMTFGVGLMHAVAAQWIGLCTFTIFLGNCKCYSKRSLLGGRGESEPLVQDA